MTHSSADTINDARRIVIKIGSALVTDEKKGAARSEWLETLAADIAALQAENKQVVIVTSGAIALGREALGISKAVAPSSIPLDMKQAAASIGQIALSRAYHDAFGKHGISVAQLLLSPSDTENRRAHLNARSTMQALLDHGVVPVINENDTVSTHEIRFGDNDRLAARVSQMIEADLLILLSTTDGLYTADPSRRDDAQHIPVVESLNEDHFNMAGDAPEGLSTGGMKSKLEAARIAVGSAVSMIISDGTVSCPVSAIQNKKSTLFVAQGSPANARKRWILAHVDPKGALVIDEGACNALRSGKSLLPIGVSAVEGEFYRGDAVRIKTKNGKVLGIGLVAYNTDDARKISGHKSTELEAILGYAGRNEIIHRDDLVLQG